MALADRALVVGINRYPGISALSGAENDAQDFYEWVTDPAGGGVNKAGALLILSSAFPPPPVPDLAQPAKEQIEAFFTDIDNCADANNADGSGAGLRAGKRLWLFFSGHGFAPSLDRSGVLMANATLKRAHNISAMLWANRLYEGGWFDEVVLFQDACRNRIGDAELAPPFLIPRLAPAGQDRKRFYAFSAKDRKLSKELPFPDGKVRGVFTTTLLQGLRGPARDPGTGAVTTAQLKGYLQDNMRKFLSEADLQDDEIAKLPEVFDPDPFAIVPPPATLAITDFPVRITLPNAAAAAQVQDANLQTVATQNPAPQNWSLRLPRGLYKLVVQGAGEVLFQVTGALMLDGSPGEVDVRV
jgi:uncharacterized caspase-like protein